MLYTVNDEPSDAEGVGRFLANKLNQRAWFVICVAPRSEGDLMRAFRYAVDAACISIDRLSEQKGKSFHLCTAPTLVVDAIEPRMVLMFVIKKTPRTKAAWKEIVKRGKSFTSDKWDKDCVCLQLDDNELFPINLLDALTSEYRVAEHNN